MLGEEAMRRLQAEAEGTDPRPEVEFLGERYEVKTEAALVPLLRYGAVGQAPARDRARAEAMGESGQEPGQQAVLAAAHQLLEETLADFPAFSRAAFMGKASGEDIQDAVLRVVEVATARPALAGLRLLRQAAGGFAELDGALLLAGGRGLGGMSPREVCNAVFAKLIAGVDPDLRAEWVEDLYLDYDPASVAMEQVRQMQADRAAREADG